MKSDEDRSARLLFSEEIASGVVKPADVLARTVHAELTSKPVPSRFSRKLQMRLIRQGRLSPWRDIEALDAARRSVLGDAAAGPPRFLLRVEGGAGPDARRVHDVLHGAGVPYLVAVPPEVPTGAQREVLAGLRRDAVDFGIQGTGLATLTDEALQDWVDQAKAVMRDEALAASDVLVASPGGFVHRQWPILAREFEVVTSGPEIVATMGWHRTPLWRGNAVFMPVYEPFAGPVDEVLPAVKRLLDRQAALWTPIVVSGAWEQDSELAGLARLASVVDGHAHTWDRFLAAVLASAAG